MSQSLEITGRTLLPDGQIAPCRIVIDRGIMTSVEPVTDESASTGPDDQLIVPAFIDLHVHGGGGYDFSSASPEEIQTILDAHGRGGTSALAATIVSSPPEPTVAAIRSIVSSGPGPHGAEIVAIHLEGPFLDPSKCGAQNPAAIRAADPAEIETWLSAADGVPLIVTIAPGSDEALRVIEQFPEIRFSIGHTGCTYDEALHAFERGATRVTHLFNAMNGLHHREPGLVGATMLTPYVAPELIADGHHVHPAVLQIAARTMAERIILVTDAIAAAGSSNATATLGGLDVRIENGAARLEDGTLAGSVILMRDALATMVELAGVPIEQVVPMMSGNPARSIGIENRKGAIAVGMDADLLVIDARMKIARRIVRGREA